MSNPKFPFVILVKYATRGRVDRFFEGMETIYNLASQTDYIRVLITADEDDLTMNNDDIKERISKYKNAHVIYGKSNNKIHAINRDFDIIPDSHKNWNILANFSDDMRFTAPMWDDYIRVHFNSVFPETLDGYMAYLDPDTHGALSTMLIAGKPFIDRFGFIYDPQFVSLFCDNLVEDVARYLGKYHYTGFPIYKHLNPAYGHLPEDTMYRQQQDIGWDIDNKLYNKIISEGIDKYLKTFNL